MILSKVKMPLMCWRCLSKNVKIKTLRKSTRVVCQEKDCGYSVTKDKWIDLAKGSLPVAGRVQQWDIEIMIPPEAYE